MPDLKVQSEVFEGPLDLLLYLVKKQEVDIYEVNLTQLATRFLEYIEVIRELDLEIAGEFLVMAATLVYIKSRELLPVEQQAVVEEEDDGNDPRWELIRKLVEYKKFKDAAAGLQAHEARQEHVYGRIPPKMEFEETAVPQKPDVSIFDLIGAVSVILKRIQQQKAGSTEIYEDKWSVSEKIELVRQLILDHGKVKFFDLFINSTSRVEVVVTFLAVLELIRLKVVQAAQPEEFGEIMILPAPIPPPAPPAGEEPTPAPENAAPTE